MNCHQLRIVYAGTPEFSVLPLEALMREGHELVAVYTQPDRPAGRGRKLRASPVKVFAEEKGIPVFQPASLRDETAQNELRHLNADVMVVAAYGLLLPESVLAIPTLGCINIHASLLPRWRGAAPIQRAIAAGDHETGVTIMQMDRGLDTGDMLLKRTLEISDGMTAQQLHDALSVLGSRAIADALPALCDGSLQAEKQDDADATYAAKITKEEAQVDWQDTALSIHRKICAFNPFPIAFTQLGKDNLRIWESRLSSEEKPASARQGEVIKSGQGELLVATGSGVLALERLQLPGKKPLSVKEFLNGRDLTGQLLGRQADADE